MVCWWAGKKHIEDDLNIGVLSFQWCADGWAEIDRGSFTYWCAGALMVCLVAGRRVGQLLCR